MTSLDRDQFREALGRARKIAVLTGAGVSAESGIPTFRGAGGLWRRYQATDLATPQAWDKDPGLVWEFYDHRRAVARTCDPNPAHHALAHFEARCRDAGRAFTLVTQNIDGLHERAGSRNVVRLHGSLWQVRCVACREVTTTHQVPIAPAFEGSGSPDPEFQARRFGEADLPHCHCGGVIRPHIVWFGERLAEADLQAAYDGIAPCDILIVVGTSAVVYPAASYIPVAKRLGATVAEVNVEPSAANEFCDAYFEGKAGEILPNLLDVPFS
ncbi:SIR2 family NAD-dependent protein deacylase [Chondromyces apiculatus]|uniref:NAD-dependent protein deacylase n=1 Tax=Chondromyces apiculatus DSM 436 TaxID=1192034 RepID=A0A017TA69_9BACT|nr:NAD-dependent deacylase [Chondromyces apiculatus]EYF06109.1 NAD-dependent protein deacetylase of SIR2 family [Chondromyces apiculatus DSM 436]